jgi:hypothetical protein
MLITDRFKKVFLGAVAIVIVFIVSGVLLFSNVARAPELVETDSLAEETEVLPLDLVMNKKPDSDDGKSDGDIDNFTKLSYNLSTSLKDVTLGKTIQSIGFSGKSTGTVKAGFFKDGYMLYAQFDNLPDPVNGAFYEGWIVDKDTSSVISSGKARKINGKFVNTYSSDKDLTTHKFYVLTLEPDDGNPKPADHILEGNF